MKFLQKLLCCKTRRRNEEAVDPLERLSKDVEKGNCRYSPTSYVVLPYHLERVTKTGKQPQGMPKWVEMKCNSLVYLKQLMKNNRKKKLLLVKQEKDQKKDQNKEKEENKETDKKEVAEIIENDSNQQEVLKSQTNESMSMMCPICHFFMYKSVCATCGHMFCQYCLDEYLIFKDSCPVCEKSIRKGKITRCCVADSAIEKMLMFSKEEYSKEYALKVKFEDEYFAKKKLNESIIEKFSQETPEIIIDARDSEYIWCKAEIIAVIESKEKDNSILVHYCGWGRKYDEVLPLNSPRIANAGFYTSRTDIPYYQSTDNKAKKPVLNMPISNEKIDIIEELKKDCMRDNDDEDENKRRIGEPGEEPLNEEEVYDYLIDKVSNRNRSAHSREPFRLNTQTTSVFDLNPFERSNRDVRIRVHRHLLPGDEQPF